MAAQEPLMNPARRPWSVALSEPESWISIAKWGAITGVGYFAFANLMNMLVNVLTGGQGNLTENLVFAIPACGGIFALVFALYTSGYLAAKERTHVAPGVLSTVFMLALAQVLGRIFTVQVQGAKPATTSTLGTAIVSLILALAFGLGIGYMGAFYGVKNKLKAVAKVR
ncbi:MAG: hypothetical protein H0X24_14500 [Ktedonobacterales bacterium]|nr:hypothetical protein [Ktedonobacterales bacterium]